MSLPWSSKGFKATPISLDELMIIDSEDANPATQNKRILIGSIAVGEINTTSNDGAGDGWAKAKVGVDLPFKSLITTAPISTTVNTNDLTLTLDQLVNADISASALIEFSKLEALSDGNILVGSNLTVPTSVPMSGDATIINSGLLTISNDAVDDNKIATQTSTKITITNKPQLNSSIVYTDQSNTYGPFTQTFPNTSLEIENPAGTFSYQFASTAITTDRTVTLPLLTGNDTFVFVSQTQTLANKTLSMPTISNFTNANHDHADAAGGGNLTNSALTSGVFSNITGVGTQTQDLQMNSNLIKSVGSPLVSGDAANKQYVDEAIQGLSWKEAALLATTANITLSGNQSIDGVLTTTGDRILVKDQTLSQFNGLYSADAGAWTRTLDADSESDLINMSVFIQQGTVNDDTSWVLTTDAPIIVDVTPLDYAQIAGSFNSPLTTTGDLLGYDTGDNRIPVGSNGQVLTANNAVALGVEWAAAAVGSQTPWTSDIDADGFDLTDLSILEFRAPSTADPGQSNSISVQDDGGVDNMVFHVNDVSGEFDFITDTNSVPTVTIDSNGITMTGKILFGPQRITGTDLLRIVTFETTASAVNYFNMKGATAGSGPTLETDGSDTNIDMILTPKGNSDGSVLINSRALKMVETTTKTAPTGGRAKFYPKDNTGRSAFFIQDDVGETEFALISQAQTLEDKTLDTGTIVNIPITWNEFRQTFNPNATIAGLNFGSQAGDPSTTIPGDVWYNTSTNKFRANENSILVDMIGGGGGSQTPWTSDIAAATFNLSNFGVLSFDAPATSDPGQSDSISMQTGAFNPDMIFHVNANNSAYQFFIGSAGTAQYTFKNNTLDMGGAGLTNPGNFLDTNNNELLRWISVASAVNYLEIENNTTGNAPVLRAGEFGDANQGLEFQARGTGNILFQNQSQEYLELIHPTGSLANYLTITPSIAANGPIIASTGTDTNVDLNINTKGTGLVNFLSKSLFTPSATVAGLNFGAKVDPDPTIPVNGDVYYNTTNNKFRAYENSVWVDMIGGGGSQTPWTSNIDADGFALLDGNYVELDGGLATAFASAGAVRLPDDGEIGWRNTGDTGDLFIFSSGDELNFEGFTGEVHDATGTIDYSTATELDASSALVRADILEFGSFIRTTGTVADAGQIRLADLEAISWRNGGDDDNNSMVSDDIKLSFNIWEEIDFVDATDVTIGSGQLNVEDITMLGGDLDMAEGNIFAAASVASGTELATTIATEGEFRMPSLGDIGWRNNADTGNEFLSLNASDQFLFTSEINVGNNQIKAVTDPTDGSDAATKTYVDNLVNGLSWKNPAVVATTGNITLSGNQTIDGVLTITGDRVLVKDQTSGQFNGVYAADTGAWTRTTDADSESDLLNMSIYISQGSTQADTSWVLTTDAPIVVDTTVLTYAQIGAGAGNPLTTKGDIFGYDTANARIPVGTDGQVLTANSAVALGVDYQTPTVGDVVGPGSATDQAVSLFDSTTGKLIKNSDLVYDFASTKQLTLPGPIILSAAGTVPAGTNTYLREDASNLDINVATAQSIILQFGGGGNDYVFTSTGADFSGNTISNADFEGELTAATVTVASGLGAGITYSNGIKQTFNPSSANAGLNVGAQADPDPSSPVNGDIYYNSTNDKFRAYENGSWADVISAAAGDVTGPASSVDNELVRFNGVTGKIIQATTLPVVMSDAGEPTWPRAILFTNHTGQPAASSTWIQSFFNDLQLNASTGNTVQMSINAGIEYVFDATNLNFNRNNADQLGVVIFNTAGALTAPLITDPYIEWDVDLAPDAMVLNVPSGTEHILSYNGVEEYTFSASLFTGNGNILRNWTSLEIQSITGSGIVRIENTDSTPTAADVVGTLQFRADRTASSSAEYATIQTVIADPAAASADGELIFSVIQANNLTEYITLNETSSTSIHLKRPVQDFTMDPTTGSAQINALEGLVFTDDATEIVSNSFIQRSNAHLIINSPTGDDIELSINNLPELTIALNQLTINPGTDLLAGGDVVVSDRFQTLKGPDVTGATTITLGDGNYFDITGSGTNNHMTFTNWQNGSIVTLQFDTTGTVTHNAGTNPANTVSFFLTGAVDFVATAGDTLTLVYDGAFWRELSRASTLTPGLVLESTTVADLNNSNLIGVQDIVHDQSAITYNATLAFDFDVNQEQTLAPTGDLTTLTTANRAAGKAKTIYVTGDTVNRTLTFNASWRTNPGTATVTITANTFGILTFGCKGGAETDVFVAYAEFV